jgi:outer membrane protein OmpA-like peptidoglycan-associated protein
LSNPQAKIKPPELPQDGTTDVAQGNNNQPAQPSASPEAQPQAQPAAAGQTDADWAEKQKEYFGRKKAELLQRAKDRLDSGRPYMNQGNVRIPAVSPEAAELGRARSVPLLPN